MLFSGLEKNVFVDTATAEDKTIPEEEVRIRLAGLLPGLARWSSLALNGLPNELVDVCRCFFSVLIVCIELIWAVICRRCWMLARWRLFRAFCSPDLRRGFGSMSLRQDLGLTHDCVTYHLTPMRYHLRWRTIYVVLTVRWEGFKPSSRKLQALFRHNLTWPMRLQVLKTVTPR